MRTPHTHLLLAPTAAPPIAPASFATRPAPDPHRLVIREPVSGRRRGAKDNAATRAPAPAAAVAGELRRHEDAVIAAALAILDARLRTPGAAFDAPNEVRDFLRLHLADLDREVFAVLYLDSQHRLIAFEAASVGTLSQTSVYPRELVRRALEVNAAAVILAHNHPSGTAEPSKADEHLTQALRAALGIVDVRTLDHVVIGGRDAVSFAECGRL